MKDRTLDYYRINYSNRKRGLYKNISKEQRAKDLNNVICPKCKYQNKMPYVIKYGKCNLCGTTLDINYFKKMLLKKLKGSDKE